MLDEKDLQSIAGLIDTSAKETRTVLTGEMDKRNKQTENLLLDELVRSRSILEDELKTVKKNMDELSQYYRITKLEGDNTTLLLKMITMLEKEVEDLKQKIA